MTHKLKILFLVSILIGVIIWVFSPYLFGTAEPWDSPHYAVINILLFVIGLSFGIAGYEKPLLWPLGVFCGSFLYGMVIFIKDIFFYSGGGVNLFFPLGIFFLIVFCIPVVVGSFIGSGLRKRYGRAE